MRFTQALILPVMLLGLIGFGGASMSEASKADQGCQSSHQDREQLQSERQSFFEGQSDEQLGFPSTSEKESVARWLQKNDLNEYGDSKETMYAGGTPLFSESSGETKTLYEYLLQKHPGKPWNQ